MILRIRREGDQERELRFDADSVLIGKRADCDVVLEHASVSRRHARLSRSGRGIEIEDLGSTNGTELDGRTIEGPTLVEPGQSIRVGPFTLLAVPEPPAPADVDDTAETTSVSLPVPGERPAAPRDPLPDFSHDDRFGPLRPLLADDSISEIMINGHEEVFIERDGRIDPAPAHFGSEEELRTLVAAIAADVGRTIDERRPMLDARLRDGSRVNAILPPLSLRGTCVTIRRFPSRRLSGEELVGLSSLSEPMLSFLRAAVGGKLSLLVSGGTGSGKTTILNALCAYLGDRERIVTIEDAAELRLPQRHVVPLETRPPDPDGTGEVSVRDLVRNALRMRPDRIVIGEVRGAEALDMLQAMNTGHEGSLGTIHANSAREALARLETLVLFAGTDLPVRAIREQICAAIPLLVHVSRTADARRRVTSIAELTGMEGDRFTIGEIFRFEPAEKGGGRFRAVGYVPRCRDRLIERGQAVDNAWFRE